MRTLGPLLVVALAFGQTASAQVTDGDDDVFRSQVVNNTGGWRAGPANRERWRVVEPSPAGDGSRIAYQETVDPARRTELYQHGMREPRPEPMLQWRF